MRILWVKAGKLLPVDTGGKIRSYNLLRHLAATNEVTLLSFYSGNRDDGYGEELTRHFSLARVIHTGPADGTGLGGAIDYARRVLSPAPYAVTKFTSPKVSRLIHDWFDERRFDAAVCDFLSASLNFPRTLTTPCVLFQHNVESMLWRRQAAHEPNLIKRLVFTLEAAKMERYERQTVRRFPHIIAVSERDREEMASMVDGTRVTVVPTGVDVSTYGALAATAEEPRLLFLGSMDWEANVDAVDYFCRDIWPAILAAVPSARFSIVGRNPHPRVQRLASDTVTVTGAVPSVIEYLREAALLVVPHRVGGGTRLKIFEAMAAGKPVVSTSVGAEGLDVHDGRDILLADTPNQFADAVVGLLRDREWRRRVGEAARELAARYDWSVIAQQFEETVRKVALANQNGDTAPRNAPACIEHVPDLR